MRPKLDERGIVFLELMIGLPLIVILLWSMNNMFSNSWYKCKYMIADFILQQEMESAMARVVETAKAAYRYEDGVFYYYEAKKSGGEYKIVSSKYRYFVDNMKMYRGVTSGNSNPITGDSWNSGTFITKFYCRPVPSNPKLLYIRLEAMSGISRHTIVLTTEVYMRGSPL